jgi:hypothetical protein
MMAAVVSEIAIYATATGALAVLAPAGTPLRAGQAAVKLPDGYRTDTFDWNTTTRTMIENASKLEAVLVHQVKAKAADLKALPLSTYPFRTRNTPRSATR